MTKKEMNMKKPGEIIFEENYQEILRDILSILDKAKSRAYKAVDNIRVQTYWQIGERIVRAELDHKDRADYGDRLIDRLSEDIGFNRRDIYRIIQFYRYYPIMTAVPSQLSWSHYIELIQISDSSGRKFYESRAIRESWSTRDLRKQVKLNLYENILKEGKPFLLCHLCALRGAKKYPGISRQYFNFWQPYFKLKKHWIHRGKVLYTQRTHLLF